MLKPNQTSGPDSGARKENMKVFQMNDCDWMAGETLEECKAEYLSGFWHGATEEDAFDDPRELTDAEMDKKIFVDNEAEPEVRRTFREQLAHIIAKGETFPTFFASSEF